MDDATRFCICLEWRSLIMASTPRVSLILLVVATVSFALFAGCSNEVGTTDPTLDTVPPTIPLDLSGDILTTSSVSLSWAANTVDPDLAGYVVYRRNAADSGYLPLTHGTVTTNSYVDTDAQPGHTYWYSVAARDIHRNESGRSAPVQVTVPDPDLPQPRAR